jgi:dTDP-4-dehydrorhamnose reductase
MTTVSTLFCFGFGYSAAHYVAEYGARFSRIVGTVRTPEKAAKLAREGFGGRTVEPIVFDGTAASDAVDAAIKEASAIIVSIPPGPAGDPALAFHASSIAQAPNLRAIVYLSTVGVYGNHDGGWVDENTPPTPMSERSRERVEAEQAWAALGERAGKAVASLRLSGIYGPGQNALMQLKTGTARRIVKPGQVFNRIHVADIAQAIERCIERSARGVFNVSDDEPAPTPDVIAYAASLLGVTPPPEIPFDEIATTMSPMALSFYGECKRVRNDKMKRELGVALRYPTYREALRAA